MSTFDVIVIGGGPGGYRAAELAAEAGKTVALCEERRIGGVCLNAGCVPTKTLLHCAKTYKAAQTGERFGVRASGVRFDMATAAGWKDRVVKKLTGGIAAELKRLGVQVLYDRAHLLDRNTV